MKKRLLSLFLAQLLVLQLFASAVPHVSAMETGSCGEDAHWYVEFDYEMMMGYNLEISGLGGPMSNYSYAGAAPWSDYSPLNSVYISSVSTIGDYAFAELGTSNVSWPSGLVSIGKYAFADADIYRANLYSGLQTIGDGAFSGSDLEEVTIPDTVTAIGKSAFADCGRLTSVKLSNGLTVIPENAFRNTPLSEVTLPASVKTVEAGAFSACSCLKKVTIPASVTSIADEAFYELSDLVIYGEAGSYAQTWAKDNGFTFAEAQQPCGTSAYWKVKDGVLTVSGTGEIRNKYVSGVSWYDYAFTDIVIEEGITQIGSSAFENPVPGKPGSIRNVTLPSTLETINSYGFFYNPEITGMTFPEGLRTIGTAAFQNCGFTEVILPGTVTNVGNWAFSYNANLTKVVIPPTVTGISSAAFYGSNRVTIHGVAGSYAQTWAKENGFPFVAMEDLSDRNPPAISVTPADGTTINGPITVTVTVSDDHGLSYVMMGNIRYEVSGTEDTLSISYDPSQMLPGYHYLFFTVYDAAGNSVDATCYYIYAPAPEVPTGFAAAENSTGIQLTWDTAQGDTVTGYSLRRSTDNLNFNEIASLDSTATAYLDTDAVSGMTYYYRLYPLWSEGEGDYAQVACTYGDYIPPKAPVLTISPELAGGDRMPTVSVTGEDDLSLDRVELFWALEGQTAQKLTVLTNEDRLSSISRSWQWDVSALESGTYLVEAIAYDASGNASAKAAVSLTVDNTAPPSLTGFGAEATVGYIHVMWDTDYQVPEDFARFELYRSTSANSGFALVSSGTGAGYYDQATVIDCNTTYYYYAVAVDRLGNVSDATEVVSAKLLTDTQGPVIVDMSPVSNTTVCKEAVLRVSAMDDYRLGKAVFSYFDGEKWALIGTVEAQGITNNHVYSQNWSIPESLTGKVTVKAEVYDALGNGPAVQTRIVNVLAYQRPTAPEVTVETGFLRATLSWSYDSQLLRTLSQFVIYQTDANGENRRQIGTVSRGISNKYTLSLEKDLVNYYVVEARDCYGAVASSGVLQVVSAPDTTAPIAQLKAGAALASIGQEVVFSGELSSDNDGIAAWEWDFDGDGIVDATGARCSHSFDAAGSYTVSLTVRDLSGNEARAQAALEICDPKAEDSAYAELWITAVNAYDEDLTAVSGAEVTAVSGDFEVTGFTDASGLVVLTIPRADCTVYVAAKGYASTTRAVAVNPRGRTGVTVGLMPMDMSVLSGELTVEEMTYEEILEAGIDTTAPGNEHVFTFETELTFVAGPGMKGMTITPVSLVNTQGQILASVNNWLDIDLSDTADDGQEGIPPMGTPSVTVKDTTRVGFFPLSEYFVLVVYGQTHWLKEMFNVELMVLNNNHLEPITDCQATLNLPKGLSLAELVEGVQTEVVDLGTIGCSGSQEGNTAKAQWYVRGDEAGVYGLSASVTGMVGQTPFVNTFTSNDMIEVYAGSALELTVYADNHTFRDIDYHMTYKLKNVSDKSLYNVSLQIDKTQLSHNFHSINLSTGQLGVSSMVIQKQDLPADGSITFTEVMPGETISLELYCQPLFMSLAHLVDIGPLDIAYYLGKMVTVASDGSTTSVPCKTEYVTVTHGSLEESFKDAVGDELVDHAVDFGADVNDLGKTDSLKGAEKTYKFNTQMGERLNSVPTLTIRLESADGEFVTAAPVMTYSMKKTPLRVYTDSKDYVVEQFEGYSIMTITGDAEVCVVGENSGNASLIMTTWAQSYAYNQETDTMEVVKRDITYTAEYHIHDEVIDQAMAPGCADTGLTEGKHCGSCGVVLVEQQVIPASGHSFSGGTCTICGEADPDYVPEDVLQWQDGQLYFYRKGQLCTGIYNSELVEINGDIYLVKWSGKVAFNELRRITDAKSNGLLEAGSYYFGEDGKLVRRSGIVWDEAEQQYYYYDNGKLCTGIYNSELVEIDGNIYLVKWSGRVAFNEIRQITDAKSNGLLEPGTYYFGEDGKLIRGDRVIWNEAEQLYYYYRNGKLGTRIYNSELVEIEGNIYLVKWSGKVAFNEERVITAAKSNGLLEPGTYYFGEDGKLIQGDRVIWNEAEQLYYYYRHGKLCTGIYNSELVEINGDIYLVKWSGKVAFNEERVITAAKSNGLLEPGTYYFGEDGKLRV